MSIAVFFIIILRAIFKEPHILADMIKDGILICYFNQFKNSSLWINLVLA